MTPRKSQGKRRRVSFLDDTIAAPTASKTKNKKKAPQTAKKTASKITPTRSPSKAPDLDKFDVSNEPQLENGSISI
jgi:hypothetical protein